MTYDARNWWNHAIERNRAALSRIVTALLALTGSDEAGATLTRHRRNHVLRLLRPAESAVRRLVVIAASRIAVIARPEGVFMYGLDPDAARRRRPAVNTEKGDDGSARIPPFALADPLKRFSFEPSKRRPKAFPRITVLGLSDPTPVPKHWYPMPDDELDARSLRRRLATLQHALDDLDGEARRLVRWQARRDRACKPSSDSSASASLGAAKYKPRSPLRTGRPPGRRKRPIHEIDELLDNLHSLALHALSPNNTS